MVMDWFRTRKTASSEISDGFVMSGCGCDCLCHDGADFRSIFCSHCSLPSFIYSYEERHLQYWTHFMFPQQRAIQLPLHYIRIANGWTKKCYFRINPRDFQIEYVLAFEMQVLQVIQQETLSHVATRILLPTSKYPNTQRFPNWQCPRL